MPGVTNSPRIPVIPVVEDYVFFPSPSLGMLEVCSAMWQLSAAGMHLPGAVWWCMGKSQHWLKEDETPRGKLVSRGADRKDPVRTSKQELLVCGGSYRDLASSRTEARAGVIVSTACRGTQSQDVFTPLFLCLVSWQTDEDKPNKEQSKIPCCWMTKLIDRLQSELFIFYSSSLLIPQTVKLFSWKLTSSLHLSGHMCSMIIAFYLYLGKNVWRQSFDYREFLK